MDFTGEEVLPATREETTMRTSGHATAAVLAVAAIALSACGGGGAEPAAETVTQTVTESSAPAAAPAPSPASTPPSGPREGGDDPVFAALDAVLATHQGAIVVDVDRDDAETYDVDVVRGGEVVELEVGPDGTVREEEREGDDDDVREAQAATVTAADAIRRALEQHPGGVLDEIELDEDDGALHWEVDLDDDARIDLAEVHIPAR